MDAILRRCSARRVTTVESRKNMLPPTRSFRLFGIRDSGCNWVSSCCVVVESVAGGGGGGGGGVENCCCRSSGEELLGGIDDDDESFGLDHQRKRNDIVGVSGGEEEAGKEVGSEGNRN